MAQRKNDSRRLERCIFFVDEVDKLKATGGEAHATFGESVQHALLKMMKGAPVRLNYGQHIDTTHVLFICGGAFVGLDKILTKTHTFGFISTNDGDDQQTLELLNARVKPSELLEFGLIPAFAGPPAHRHPPQRSVARNDDGRRINPATG